MEGVNVPTDEAVMSAPDDPIRSSAGSGESTALVMAINLPKTSNNFRTSKNVNLHFRYFLPKGKIESVVFWVHGYGGHCNHPRIIKIAENITIHGRALFAIDLEGHGYSEGERALFRTHTALVEDIYDFVAAVTGITTAAASEGGLNCVIACMLPMLTTNVEPQLTSDMGIVKIDQLKKLPFYIMGNSLGGALCVFLSIKLFGHYRFKGVIMLAPSIDFKTPNSVISGLLELTYATFAPGDEMPDWIIRPRDTRAITWQEEVVIKQAEQG